MHTHIANGGLMWKRVDFVKNKGWEVETLNDF